MEAFSILTLLIFLLAYAGIIFKREKALVFIYVGVLLLLGMRVIDVSEIPHFLNYNVLGIFLGMSIISFLLAFSGIPSRVVARVASGKHTVGVTFLLICVITSAVSVFVENVATIMIMAPVALELAKKHRLNPVPLFVGMAVSSNLQGCATMVGDSPSIILAMESGMGFNDFFWMPASMLASSGGKPGIFFFVQAGAIAGFIVLWMFFRRWKKVLSDKDVKLPEVRTRVPLVLASCVVLSLAVASLFLNNSGFSYFPAVICLFYGLSGLLWFALRFKSEKISIKYIDWDSFFLLVGIFILVGALRKMGYIEMLAEFLEKTGGENPFILYNVVVWMSVSISSFVDNIPYSMAMISGIRVLTANLGLNPFIFLFGLLLGTCVGGNITPVGASCNVVAMGKLKKEGYVAGFKDFVKIGFPFTILAVLTSSMLMWLVYM